ncbi:epoxyqueuosine reductase [Halanaerobiaceae bacterium Z-7014]|uniref:Epoxyqueuosine reductase n=1 Tax=Halonatronomonas betaini TaxID=2778430 RepID=A0A931F8P5_9FIRM|nr:QueG-associated DUF1730 domain-containing protein [Halonatronomonas betaini]MBF8436753.1 epoxyqueuosine reductase [Halonatronomonas betaini]
MRINNWLEKVKSAGLKVGILPENLLIKYKRDYSRQLKDAGSLLVFLQPYPELLPPVFGDLGYKLKLSKYARGIDYHNILKDKINLLANALVNNIESKLLWIGVDNHFLPEKKLAYEAGLGEIGYNTLLINPEIGTYSFIGLMAVNIKIEINHLNSDKICCDSCKLCQKHCPGKALYLEDGIPKLYKEKCISYLTQKKGVLGRSQDKLISNNFWGCDICQQVCPYNNTKTAKNIRNETAKEWTGIKEIDPEWVINSYLEKKKIYNDYAFSWRGNRVLVRNLLINLSNIKNRQYNNIVDKLEVSNSPIIEHYLSLYNKMN